MAGLLDMERHFVFYGAFHSNPINVLIHVLCVWPILFSALLLLHFTPPFFSLSSFVVDASLVIALGYAGFYLCLDRRAGSLAALLCAVCWLGSGALARRLGPQRGLQVGVALQVFCWTAQFIGHGVFEGRAPALLTNLSQAFLMAPFFVLLEVLQWLGYEPYPGFKASVSAKVAAEREAWQASKQKKSS